MTLLARLCPDRVDSFRADGTLMDLAHPDVMEIDFCFIARRLSKLARFNGTPEGAAFSVAQHSVMGAEALLNEGEPEITAALFLLHDAHESLVGDATRPFQDLVFQRIAVQMPKAAQIFRAAIHDIKAGWDDAIFAAAGLPLPAAWTNRQKAMVKAMDDRMCAAESRSLFGPAAARLYPVSKFKQPKTKGAIRPWGAMKAEEAFVNLFIRLIGQERLTEQRAIHAAHAGQEY